MTLMLCRIEKLSWSGLLKHWKNKHWPPDLCAVQMEEMRTASRALTLDDLRVMFLILLAGLSVATITLGCEKLFKTIGYYFKRISHLGQVEVGNIPSASGEVEGGSLGVDRQPRRETTRLFLTQSWI